MIVYRCLTSDEIISSIKGVAHRNSPVRGFNTFKYNSYVSYKHFFLFAEHADYFRNRNERTYPCIGQYIIPNESVAEKGFGFYDGVKTIQNDSLYHYSIPLPEIIIDNRNYSSDYLYKLESNLYDDFIIKKLNGSDNEKYSEKMEEYQRVRIFGFGYFKYSYADIYYEIVWRLAQKYNMDLKKVASALMKINLHDEIQKFYRQNQDFFKSKTKQLINDMKK